MRRWTVALAVRSVWVLSLLMVVACGRVGFDSVANQSIDPSARLASIELWAAPGAPLAAPMSPAFDPLEAQYAVDVGLSMAAVQVSATPADPTTTITIAAVPTAAGVLSSPIALALGTTTIEVIATASTGATATYRIDVQRASQLAQEAYAKASNPGATDYFGWKVSLSGDTLAVAAMVEDSGATGIDGAQADESAPDSGAVYVFVRSGTAWMQQAYIKASNTGAGDYFGYSVALENDTLVVGSLFESSSATGIDGNQADNSAPGSGAVYVFVRTGATWSQQAYIKASNTGANDYFGENVSLSGDTLAVGARFESSNATGINGNQADNSASQSGAAYVFVRSGTTWSQQAYLKASNAQAGAQFGTAVALSGDTLAVTAPLESSNATGVNGDQVNTLASSAGAAYVFVRSGTTWSQQAYVKASNTNSGDMFGFTASVSGDTLAVTAFAEASAATGIDGNQADNSATTSGAVYVFARTGTTWSQQAYVKASNTGSGDQFGYSLSIEGDTLAVGARFEASNATGVNGDQTNNAAGDSGAVYVFTRTTTWTQQAYLKASNTRAGDHFGHSVSVSGDTIAVGARAEDSAATDSGAVYMFR